jgi:N-acetylmuramoyl-L-alanine amidase
MPVGGAQEITNVSLHAVSDTLTQVVVEATGSAAFRTIMLTAPDRLAFDVADMGLGPGLRDLAAPDNPAVRGVRIGTVAEGAKQFGRVVIDLKHAVDFSITTQIGPNGTTYFVNLRTGLPGLRRSTGALNGKVVMIDPGHGGQDTGAIGLGGVREKDLALAIALKLRDVLQRNGASVFMTRRDDTFIPVGTRPELAIAAHADYYVSIHCDACAPNNSHSGTTVYYHSHNDICRRLAGDISARVGAVSGIPALGTKSDTIRFASGFGVLRGSPMPAVLVECGYVDNARDLAVLCSPGAQERIAEGIAAGLIDFAAEAGAR